MDVYDGAVMIRGKDGRELRPWRVAVYQDGGALRYVTVTASDSNEAAERARRRWPDGNIFTL